MKKHICFLHQNYPAQFGPISEFLLKNYDVEVSFFSEYVAKPVIPGVKHYFYRPQRTGHEENPYFYSRHFEQEAANMHGIHEAIIAAGIEPDLFVGHAGFGTLGLLHAEFPEIPKIGYFEYFYDPYGRVTDSRPEYPAPKPNRLRVPLRNATQLIELEYCTKGYSPTHFQKSTYPEAYQHKIEVLFDGIDTDFYCPGEVGPDSELKRTWPTDAKIVTYVSRGLEAMRGFDIFMEVAHQVCQKRDDVHFVIAGNPRTHYGSEMIHIPEKTFKEYVLKHHTYDLNRFHFLNWISESALRDLFRLSDCHFYWTTPFTISWSLFQAMATRCLILGSDCAPVREVLKKNITGHLAPPYDMEQMTEKLLEILGMPKLKHQLLQDNASQLMKDRYSLPRCLAQLSNLYLSNLWGHQKNIKYYDFVNLE